MSLLERLARLFREPADTGAATGRVTGGGTPVDDPSATPDASGAVDAGERNGNGDEDGQSDGTRRDDGVGDTTHETATETSPDDRGTDAVAVVVQAPSAGVRRFELTVRAGVPVAGVDPGILTSLFESFDEGPGVVRARAVDVDGKGTEVETAAPLFTVRFAEPVEPDSVSVDGTIDGHDEEPVPWSRVRLTPVG